MDRQSASPSPLVKEESQAAREEKTSQRVPSKTPAVGQASPLAGEPLVDLEHPDDGGQTTPRAQGASQTKIEKWKRRGDRCQKETLGWDWNESVQGASESESLTDGSNSAAQGSNPPWRQDGGQPRHRGGEAGEEGVPGTLFCLFGFLVSCFLDDKHLIRQPTRAYPIAGIHEDFEGSIPCLFNCSSTTPRDLRLPFIRQLITTLAARTNHSRPIVVLNGLREYIPLFYFVLISAINHGD